ncbi:hypothetical protein HDU80_009050 [Chytriomyces hyalinus]|nr:hypothetical protein HDU80_009050 [Chytriomyces hyalinus]
MFGLFSSSAPAHPFTLGETVCESGGWTQHRATKQQTEVSVFVFDGTKNKDRMPLARNALKRLKTLRHPDMLGFVDGAENDNQVIIGTEPVTPLSLALSRDPSLAEDQNFIALGLYKIASAVKFLNADVSLTHGNIRISSIYITKSGEWKLGGLDILSNLKDPQPLLIDWGSRMPDSYKYAPPELGNGVWSAAATNPIAAIDSWAFGCLIYELFNNTTLTSREALTNLSKIPKPLVMAYKHLLNSNPKARADVATVFEKCKSPNGYFSNEFIQVCLALEQFSIKEAYEKDQFLNKINASLDTFPADFCKHKILPELIKALEFGGAGAKALAPILKIGNKLDNAEFESLLVPILVKMFALPDRAIRVSLCENFGGFIERLNPKILNDKIFTNLSTGFNDTNAVVRECTLRSVLVIAPKLNERLINNDLLRFLAKLQGDEEPGIRANTTICLGKLASHLNEATRKKVLIAAFARSLHDPFPPARNAGLLAFQATHEYYSPQEIAQKVIPSISQLLLDPERFIRTQAFKNMDLFLKKLEKHSSSMPEHDEKSAVSPTGITASGGTTASAATGAQPDGWANWAVGAISSTIATAASVAASSAAAAAVAATAPAGRTSISSEGGGSNNAGGKVGSFNAAAGPTSNGSSANGGGFAGSATTSAQGFGSNGSAAPARPNGVATSGMSLKPKAVPLPQVSDWDDGWDEKPKKSTSSVASPQSTKNGWGDDEWDAQPAKPAGLGFGQMPSATATASRASPVSSFGGGATSSVSSFGVSNLSIGSELSTGDREAEKQRKREQLALLREQKKAAIAAKKMNQ